MDGPNVTQLRSKVVEECDKEARVAAGSTTRDTLAIQEAVPGEARVVSKVNEPSRSSSARGNPYFSLAKILTL